MKPVVQFYQKLLVVLKKYGGKEIKGMNIELASDFNQLDRFAQKLGDKLSAKFDQDTLNELLAQVGVHNKIMDRVHEFLQAAFRDLSTVKRDPQALRVWWGLHGLLWKYFDAHFLYFDKVIEREGKSGVILMHVSDLSCALAEFSSYWSYQKPIIESSAS